MYFILTAFHNSEEPHFKNPRANVATGYHTEQRDSRGQVAEITSFSSCPKDGHAGEMDHQLSLSSC